jgi:hypothetical protein
LRISYGLKSYFCNVSGVTRDHCRRNPIDLFSSEPLDAHRNFASVGHIDAFASVDGRRLPPFLAGTNNCRVRSSGTSLGCFRYLNPSAMPFGGQMPQTYEMHSPNGRERLSILRAGRRGLAAPSETRRRPGCPEARRCADRPRMRQEAALGGDVTKAA